MRTSNVSEIGAVEAEIWFEVRDIVVVFCTFLTSYKSYKVG